MRQPKKVNNLKVVILSLVAASIFWFFRALGKQYNSRISHPISYVYNKDSLIAVDDLTKKISIEVTGGGWDLLKHNLGIGVQPMQFPLEEPTKIKNLNKSQILPVVTNHLSRFRVNFLYTEDLPIKIEEKKQKCVRIFIDSTKISLAENYRIVSPISFAKDSIELIGPASFIDTLDNAYELVLNFEEIDRPFDRGVKIQIPQENGIKAIPENIGVEFEVDEFYKKTIQTKIDFINFPENKSFNYSDSIATIDYTIQSSYDEKFKGNDFKIIADYNLFNKKDSIISTIAVFYPEKIIELSMSPDSVKISAK